MKTIISLPFIGFLCVSIFACSGKKSTTATPPTPVTTTASTPPATNPLPVAAQPVPAEKDTTLFRFVVSFYSKGEGIDYKSKDEFEKFLNSYPKKITFEPTAWGREGEVDYCLKLNELSAIEQTDFVRKAKELLSKSALVHVDENAKCVHKH